MNSAKRLEAIRATLSKTKRVEQVVREPAKAVTAPKGLFCALNPDAEESKQQMKRKTPPKFIKPLVSRPRMMTNLGVILHPESDRFQWVRERDERIEPGFVEKRIKRVNPLTKIAEQLPMKLKRL